MMRKILLFLIFIIISSCANIKEQSYKLSAAQQDDNFSVSDEEEIESLRLSLYNACIIRAKDQLDAYNSNPQNMGKQIIVTFEDEVAVKQFCKCEADYKIEQADKMIASNLANKWYKIDQDIWFSKIQAEAIKICLPKYTKSDKGKK